MNRLKIVFLAAATLAGASGAANAMPLMSATPLVATASDLSPKVEDVRWVCGPYRCFHRPNYYRPRPYWHRHYGWRRHWRRW